MWYYYTMHNHKETVIKTDGTCPGCNKMSLAIDTLLKEHVLVDTGSGFTFNPPLPAQKLLDEVQKNNHNHITRDIKPYGQCPACDVYHRKHSKND